MTRLLLVGFGLVAMAGLVSGQDQKADDRVKVEIHLSTEHVPMGLKAGTRVDLKLVSDITVSKDLAVLVETRPSTIDSDST